MSIHQFHWRGGYLTAVTVYGIDSYSSERISLVLETADIDGNPEEMSNLLRGTKSFLNDNETTIVIW
jgi:hypothetical protein